MASIRQLPSGLWHARVRRQGRPAQVKSFHFRGDAVAWARWVESEQERGIWQDRSEAEAISLSDLLDEYSATVSHQANNMHYLLKRLADDLGIHTVAALTPAVLLDWRDHRLECVSPATVRRELSALGGAMSWAMKDRLISLPGENPVSAIRWPRPPRARDRRLESGEEARLLEALRTGTRNPWMKPLVLLAIETAMRRGELVRLTWNNVDLIRNVAHLPDTKNGEARDVPLSSRAVTLLQSLPHSTDNRVFPLTGQAVQLSWKRVTKRAGIDNLHFHDLRHEAVSRLAEKLPNLIELSAVTGHKDLRMLKRYHHPRASDLAKKLD